MRITNTTAKANIVAGVAIDMHKTVDGCRCLKHVTMRKIRNAENVCVLNIVNKRQFS